MRIGLAVAIGGAVAALAVVGGLVAMGWIIPLRERNVIWVRDRECTEIQWRLRDGLSNVWYRHGHYELMLNLPDGSTRTIKRGEYRDGKEVGTWQTWRDDGTPWWIRELSKEGDSRMTRWYDHGVLMSDDHQKTINGHHIGTWRKFAADGTVVMTKVRDGSDLTAIDGVPVTMVRSASGNKDRAVHRGAASDGKPLEIVYHLDLLDNVREMVRIVDGVEVERTRKDRLTGLEWTDTYDYERHAPIEGVAERVVPPETAQ